ncbi:MAG: NAD(P)-dependent alcohol dehydrogenase [Thermoleophilia bacterium]
MRAIVHHVYGPPGELAVAEAPDPVPGAGQVLVRVHAASVNPADRFGVVGEPLVGRLSFGLRRPRQPIPGRDLAGRIVAVGPGARRLRVGDDVFGEALRAFAELAAVDEGRLAPMPAGATYEQAAAIPLAGTTALQGVRACRLAAGQRLLVNGAAGGVGTFAVQLAREVGAEVTGVCSAANADLVRALGATRAVAYDQEDATAGDVRYDAILDLVGNHPLGRLTGILAPRGTLVLASGGGGRWLGPIGRMLAGTLRSTLGRQRVVPLVARQTLADLEELAGLVAAGRIAPAVERVVELPEVPGAVARLASGHARGKTVVRIGRPADG